MAASITMVIAFVMFMIFGDGIEQTLVWMMALVGRLLHSVRSLCESLVSM